MRGGLCAVAMIAWAGCLDSPVTECAGGVVCPPGLVCDDVHGGCVLPEQLDECEGAPPLSDCSYPGTENGSCYDGVCLPGGCGNDIVDPGEVCDDGDTESGDGCSFDCQSTEVCGNGYPDLVAGEECDDGDDANHDGCDECALERPSWSQPMLVPPPRGGAMAFDAARGRVVLFGGGIDGGQLGDTWEWTGTRWVDVSPPVSPAARVGHAMAYDAVREQVVLFGGTGVNGLLGDTWVWDGAAWREVMPPPGDRPDARYYHAMAWDPVSERVILHGGLVGEALDETWAWDGAVWSRLAPTATPGARAIHAMATDPQRDRVVLFGGTVGGTEDVVEWNGATWSTVASGDPAPPVRGYHGMAWDPVAEAVLVFGGDTGTLTLADAWAWNGSGWTDMTPAVANLLSPRILVAGATDTVRDRLVAFGGMLVDIAGGDVLDVYDDTLLWNGISWEDRAPSASVPSSSSLSLAYDARRGRVVSLSLDELWAWRDGVWSFVTSYPGPTGSTQMTYDAGRDVIVVVTSKIEVWEWSAASGWNQAVENGPWPPDRTASKLVYDAANEQVVMFGGSGLSENLADTWTWNGSGWTDMTAATSPSPRWGHGLAYDSARERVVLFGGGGDPDDLADTWEWDGSQWTEVTSFPAPSPRSRAALAYDARRERVILFSGEAPTVLTDTWEWDGAAWTQLNPVDVAPAPLTFDMAYDAAAQTIVLHGSMGGRDDTWTFRYAGPATRDDLCAAATDRDGDGLGGCDDPNCDAFCIGCGDGTCNPDLESCALCPADCCP